ncbi:MAG: YkgJ family cysteine cluster protein [Candidatus Helarchaeota archaeon]
MIHVKNIIKIFQKSEFAFLIDIFSQVIENLIILEDEEKLENWNNFIKNSLSVSKEFKDHPIHFIFKDILLNSIIIDGLVVYDAIRNIFLYKIACFSPDCLNECTDEHGCCHSSYLTNRLDYGRIIKEGLLDKSQFIIKNKKYQVKTKNIENGIVCAALDDNSRKCLIHKYKPTTCSKYPLINNVNIWDEEKKCWVGKCAHFVGEKPWGTKVHPVIIQSLRDLWIKAQLIWEAEDEVINKYAIIKESQDLQTILKYILGIRKCKYIVGRDITIKILSKYFDKNKIEQVYKMSNMI